MAGKASQQAAAQEEEQIIRTRYLTQATVPRGEAPFKRLTKKFLALCEEAGKDSPEALDRAYQALLKEISLFEVQADKYDTMLLANQRDQEQYANKQQELVRQIQQAELDIAAAKLELEQAKIVRQQNEEYEVLRELLMTHPSRAATQKEIDKVQAAIAKTQLEGQRATATMQRRRQQFALLFHVIEELQRTVDDPLDLGEGLQALVDGQSMDVDM